MHSQATEVILISKELEKFKLKIEEAILSRTIKKILLEFPIKSGKIIEIPLYQFSSFIIAKIVDYCRISYQIDYRIIKYKKRDENCEYEKHKNKNVENFFKMSSHSLLKISIAANYLEIEELTGFSTKLIAASIAKGEISLYKKIEGSFKK